MSSISVPVAELEKLEQSRNDLYDYLGDKLTREQLFTLTTITDQIWRVANTKRWPNPN